VETPAGQFNTLRLKCDLDGVDSFYVDTTFGGYSIPRLPTTEYKWLAKGIGVPVLQITATQPFFGQQAITGVTYYSPATSSIEDAELAGDNCELYPNPANQKSTLFIQSYKDQPFEVQLTDLQGRNISKVYSGNITKGENKIGLNLESLSLDFGIYLLKVKTPSEEKEIKVVIE
jgi:hypothetical protein